MNQEKIFSEEQKTPVLSVRKKLVGLDKGLDEYSNLDEDEKDNQIPFAISHYATSENAKKLLRRYISDLKKGVCRESLGIDFGQMSKTAYWLGKCAKLKRDMEAMGDVPMKAHGFVFTVIDFSPETTGRAVVQPMVATTIAATPAVSVRISIRQGPAWPC